MAICFVGLLFEGGGVDGRHCVVVLGDQKIDKAFAVCLYACVVTGRYATLIAAFFPVAGHER